MLGKVEYAKYIPPLKTCSKQNELERVWELITKDPEFAVALRKRKIAQALRLNSTTLADTFERIYLLFYTHLPTKSGLQIVSFFHLYKLLPLAHRAHRDIEPSYQHQVVSLRTLWQVERILILPKSVFMASTGFIPINLIFSLFKTLTTFWSLETHSLLLFDGSSNSL